MRDTWMKLFFIVLMIGAVLIDFVSRVISMMCDGLFVAGALVIAVIIYYRSHIRIKALESENNDLRSLISNDSRKGIIR